MEDRLIFDRERFLAQLTEMICIDSENSFEGDMTAYLEKWFTERGYEVIRDHAGSTCGSTGDNIIVHIPGTMPGEAICFNAHQDTVIPGKGIRPHLEGDRLLSAGDTILGADDKSGIALLIEALQNIEEKHIPHREMYYLFTIGEENGQTGAHALDPAMLPCKNIMSIDDAGRPDHIDLLGIGCWSVKAKFHGRAAHASLNIDEGISAIQMMSDAIASMSLGKTLDNVRINIGTVKGGSANGSVPENAEFTAGIYGFDHEIVGAYIGQMKEICEASASKFGGSVDFFSEKRISIYHQEQDWFIFKCCYDAYVKEGITPKLTTCYGAGDANVLNDKGFRCGGIASGMDKCHTLTEYLDLNDFALAYRIIMRMMTDGFEG